MQAGKISMGSFLMTVLPKNWCFMVTWVYSYVIAYTYIYLAYVHKTVRPLYKAIGKCMKVAQVHQKCKVTKIQWEAELEPNQSLVTEWVHNAFILQGITNMSKGMQMRAHDEEVA